MTTYLTLEQAQAIVNLFDDAGLLEPPVPTDPQELIEAAREIVGSAQRAKSVGMDNDVVNEVLRLSEPSADTIPPQPSQDPPWDTGLTKTDTTDTTKEASTATPNGDVARFDDESPATGSTIAAEEDTAAASTDATPLESDQEKESSSPLPALPRDFSKLADADLRSWHARLHADYAQVVFDLGLEEADYESAQVSLDQAKKIAMSKVTSEKVTDRREQAATDPEVMDWVEKMDAHHKKVILYRAYEKIIDRQITGLSREFSMRSGERNNTPA